MPRQQRIVYLLRTVTPCTRYLVFPDGEEQQIDHTLRINVMVDINGIPLQAPLPTTRMIAYRVCRVVTSPDRREEVSRFHLELLTRPELEEVNTGGP